MDSLRLKNAPHFPAGPGLARLSLAPGGRTQIASRGPCVCSAEKKSGDGAAPSFDKIAAWRPAKLVAVAASDQLVC